MQTISPDQHRGSDAVCRECGQLTWLRWTGLAACRNDPEQRHEPVFTIYCPTCAERGFRPVPSAQAA